MGGANGVNVQYPPSFVEKVRDEFRDRPDVVSAAEGSRYGLGVALASYAVMTMSNEDIVASIDGGDCLQVREDAARASRRRGLHAEWMRIVLKSLSDFCDVQSPSMPPPSVRRPRASSFLPGISP